MKSSVSSCIGGFLDLHAQSWAGLETSYLSLPRHTRHRDVRSLSRPYNPGSFLCRGRFESAAPRRLTLDEFVDVHVHELQNKHQGPGSRVAASAKRSSFTETSGSQGIHHSHMSCQVVVQKHLVPFARHPPLLQVSN